MKIFCIGRNYVEHIKELNNPMPDEPIIFMKPSTSLLLDNKDFYHPAFSENIHYEVELVVKIIKHGKHIQPQFSHLYYNQIGLGIDFTARDVQSRMKEKGQPWEKAKAFDGSAVMSKMIDLDKELQKTGIEFSLKQNGVVVQEGNSNKMITDIDALIAHLSEYFTLQTGDLIYTGTPAGVGQIAVGDLLEGFIGDQQMFSCRVK